ncbi:MAG: TIGR03905 family TSCPD domain-containing protein [Bacillota bacterium]
MISYKTKGVCSRQIDFDIENGKITKLKFVSGCPGNLQGISQLCIGRNIDEIIPLLEGIKCRNGTSCPDQLSKALKEYKSKN